MCFSTADDGCIITVTKSNEVTFYYYDSNMNSYYFGSSLSWDNSLSYFYSSKNPRKHNPDDCEMSDETRKTLKISKCVSTFKSTSRVYIDRFNAYR